MAKGTPYEQRIDDAEFDGRVAAVRDRIRALPDDRRREVGEQFPGGLARVESVLDYALVVITRTNPALLPTGAVVELEDLLDDLRIYVERTVEQQAATFSSADEQADKILDALARWTPKVDVPADVAVKEVAATFRRSAAQQFATLEGEVNAARDVVGELRERLAELDGQIASDRENSNTAVDDLRQTVEAQKGRLEQAIQTYQQQFSDEQANRASTFQTQVSQLEQRISSVESGASDRVQELYSSLEERAGELISELERRRDQVIQLHEVIAVTGTASAYGTEAKQQKKAADVWRIVAVVFAVAAAGLAFWAIIHAQGDGESVAELVSKAIGTVVFGGIAGYAAKQSSDHRSRERNAKRRELELTAFGPFIDDLDPERQQITREKVADRMFGQPDESEGHDEALTENSVSLLGRLAEIIRGGGPQ